MSAPYADQSISGIGEEIAERMAQGSSRSSLTQSMVITAMTCSQWMNGLRLMRITLMEPDSGEPHDWEWLALLTISFLGWFGIAVAWAFATLAPLDNRQ